MELFFVTMETGYGGETGHDLVEGPLTQEDLWEIAVQWAESYGREFCPEDEECEHEECEYEHSGNTNIEAYAVPYVAEDHDPYL